MSIRHFSTSDPTTLRDIADDPDFQSEQLFKGESKGHKFKAGETRTLTGLMDFPEFEGQKVKIAAIRLDGPFGRAYYIEGKINRFLNWIYESRLK